jgi:hypothetical protein
MPKQWLDAQRYQAPEGVPVAVLVAGRTVPMVGWNAGPSDPVPGWDRPIHSWRVPGYGGVVTHWCDCIPPWSDPPPPEKVAGTIVRMGP